MSETRAALGWERHEENGIVVLRKSHSGKKVSEGLASCVPENYSAVFGTVLHILTEWKTGEGEGGGNWLRLIGFLHGGLQCVWHKERKEKKTPKREQG